MSPLRPAVKIVKDRPTWFLIISVVAAIGLGATSAYVLTRDVDTNSTEIADTCEAVKDTRKLFRAFFTPSAQLKGGDEREKEFAVRLLQAIPADCGPINFRELDRILREAQAYQQEKEAARGE